MSSCWWESRDAAVGPCWAPLGAGEGDVRPGWRDGDGAAMARPFAGPALAGAEPLPPVLRLRGGLQQPPQENGEFVINRIFSSPRSR